MHFPEIRAWQAVAVGRYYSVCLPLPLSNFRRSPAGASWRGFGRLIQICKLTDRQPTPFPNFANHGRVGKTLAVEDRQSLGRAFWRAGNKQAT